MQVQQRQHLSHLRRLACPHRQDGRGKPLPLTGIQIDTAPPAREGKAIPSSRGRASRDDLLNHAVPAGRTLRLPALHEQRASPAGDQQARSGRRAEACNQVLPSDQTGSCPAGRLDPRLTAPDEKQPRRGAPSRTPIRFRTYGSPAATARTPGASPILLSVEVPRYVRLLGATGSVRRVRRRLVGDPCTGGPNRRRLLAPTRGS